MVKVADRLAQAVTRAAGGDLSTRVDPAGPAELSAAGEAFDHMADQLARLPAAEREAAADLSHRLRTPLTALRLNLSGLAASRSSPLSAPARTSPRDTSTATPPPPRSRPSPWQRIRPVTPSTPNASPRSSVSPGLALSGALGLLFARRRSAGTTGWRR